MDNFFDDLRNNLENRPEPEFEESAWLAMQKKMQPEGKKPSRPFGGWWWLGGLVIPLLLSNVWMYFQMGNAKALLENVEIQRDTIYKTKIIYQTDTIYQTKIIHETIANNSLNQTNTRQNITLHLQKPFLNSTNFNEPFVFGKNRNSNNSILQNTPLLSYGSDDLDIQIRKNESTLNDSITSNEKAKINFIGLPSLASNFLAKELEAIQLIDIQQLATVKTASRLKKRMQALGNTFRPKEFHLGIGAGLVYPLNGSLQKRDGESLGLSGSVVFSKNLRLWMDASYVILHLEADDLADDNFGIPAIPLPNDDYTFEEAKADQPLFEFSLGMQYVFNSDKKLRPYLGLGYSTIALQPYEVDYEYEDLNEEEIIVPRDYSTKGLINNMWIAKAGLEYHFGKKWYGQVEGYYRASWEKEGNLTPNILGSNIRLMYRW